MANVLKKDIAGDYALRLAWRYQDIDFLGLPNLKDNPSVRLDDIYVPLRVHWDSRRDPEKRPLYIPEALEQCAAEKVRHLVVLGDPGSGKSTLIKVLVSAFGRSAGSSFKRLFGDLLPVPIILRDYQDKVRRWQTKEDMLSAFIATLDAEIRDEISTDWLLDELREGRGFLLLDGLDEVGDRETRKQLRDKVVRPLLKEIPASFAILTSRIVGYDEVPFEAYVSLEKYAADAPDRWFPLTIRRCYVAPFTDEDIEQFIVRWYRARESSPDKQQAGIESFKRALGQNDRVRRLAGNPLLLTLMALVHRVTANLPSGRVKLYDKIVEAFLETIQVYRKLGTPATLDEMKRWLAKVGWQMQQRRASLKQSDEELLVHRDEVLAWVTEAISEERGASEAREDAEKFLDYVARRSGLLIPRGPEHFAFVHLTFQEYFAAFELRGKVRRFDKLAELCAELVAKRHWHETINLLFEMLTEFSGAGNDLFDEIKNRAANDFETKEAAAELFSALLLDEESGLNRKKQQEAFEFALEFVCDNYNETIIKNLRELSEPVKTWVEDWFNKHLEEATSGNSFGKNFFLVGAELFNSWPNTLSDWLAAQSARELNDLQVVHLTLIAARDLETYPKIGSWAIERLPLDMWLRRIVSDLYGYNFSLADIYRRELYSSLTLSPRHRLLVEANVALSICSAQALKIIVLFFNQDANHSQNLIQPVSLIRSLSSILAHGLHGALADNLDRALAQAVANTAARDHIRDLACFAVHIIARDLDISLNHLVVPEYIRNLARSLAHDVSSYLIPSLNMSQRPEIQADKFKITKAFADSEWMFFVLETFDQESAELINKLQTLAQAEEDWTRLLALAALLSLGEGSPDLCNERNALLEKGIKRSASFTFPAELHPETETPEFRAKLPELLEISYLHNPDDIWLRAELFDPARPESKYFLAKPREFFMLAAEALDPERETELWKWREAQKKKSR